MVSPKSSQNHTVFCHINFFLVNYSTILNRVFFCIVFSLHRDAAYNNNNSEKKRKQMPSWTGITMRVKSFCWMPYFKSLNVYHFQNGWCVGSLLLSIFSVRQSVFLFHSLIRTILTYTIDVPINNAAHASLTQAKWFRFLNDWKWELWTENDDEHTHTKQYKMEWYGMTWYGIMVFISFCCKFSNYNQIDETMVFFIKTLWLKLSLCSIMLSHFTGLWFNKYANPNNNS